MCVFACMHAPRTHPTHQPTPPLHSPNHPKSRTPTTQGCLVWGPEKAEAVLDALSPSSLCSKALAFTYGCHPADAALLGKRTAHDLQLLAEVPPSLDLAANLWCRLPGSTLQHLAGSTLPEHHAQRMRETRLVQRAPLLTISECGCSGGEGDDADSPSPFASRTPSSPSSPQWQPPEALRVSVEVGRLEAGSFPADLEEAWRRIKGALAADSASSSPSPCGCASSVVSSIDLDAAGFVGSSEPPSTCASLATSLALPSCPPVRAAASSGAGSSVRSAAGSAALEAVQPPSRCCSSTSGGGDDDDDASAVASPFAGLFGGEEEWEDEFVIVASGGW